ncbi:hypothetical protein FRACYDRAFT_206636 [Fragilariopsis cylindrus CCMP1102]|uniref:Fanconi-associated nuclease n=1 Tax=Fragilariopsis cylindrus CCMP1102 TaxID=635003 RepID=A0A1E7FNT8_9STRA|nr:hypothetical protein FRACYDRAFT_206636 [Fragilariopsis cylindrus CCMP1102]|eukprot:OEU19839.1 hypothetical protein FRACYDRAFT_206636 [Fragilariopsis cylindrus CCMP1102]
MASISPITPSSSLSLKSSSLKPPSPLLLSLLPISAFPLSSSAYFQSLAEICYAILWDARWRVQEVDGESDHHHHQQRRRLFTWEQGDDLSVMHTLSRRYVEPPDHRRKQSNNNDNDNDDDINSHDNDTSNELNQEEQKLLNEKEETNNDHDRCLEMYTRLYFRKGPWFRLDTIFTSYYLPKKNENQEERNLAEELQQQQQQQPTSSAKPSTELSSHGDDYIDQEYLDLQMEAVKVFLGDIKQLFQMGFIRSFQNEEECGKVIGKTKDKYDYTAASLLRQDEQRTVLAKLGGCGRKKIQTKTNRHFNYTNNRNIPTDCDTSISKNQNNNNVLPVIKHVHRILVEKWASAIVLKASKVEYVPLGILRSATQRICDVLLELTSGRNNTIITSNSSNDIITSIMCLRLRENPLKVLHRASRLYLCATSGPGDMRNDGTNAWRSLPNAHTKDLQKIPLRTNCVSPPGGSWSTMSYPGKDWRMRIKSFQFIRAYKPIILDEFSTDAADIHTSKCDDIQVFSNVQSFHQWELGVGIRENCDFLLETNDLLLYNERKRAREGNPDEDNNNDSPSGNIDDASSEDDSTFIEETMVDFFDLLTIVGRSKIIEGILAIKKEECKNMESSLKNECERILGVIGIILIHVLEFRDIAMHETDVTQLASRPWLRHMNWEGCISYILWDVIPIFERRGYYHFAINALEVLLFGRRLERTATNQSIPDSFVPSTEHFSLISRRARGKALDRLVIDYTHCGSKKAKSTEAKKTMSPKSTASEVVARLIKPLLIASVGRGQITFSAIRTLARRLKCPLSHTLQGLEIYEVNELGHRLGSGEEQQDMTKYIDWQPITDTTVANALNTETNTVGGRCSFIGFEEDDQTNHIGSLNVEELAKEYYYQGRLPAIDNSPIKGGWIGYHDEGGKIRTLFRILSSEPLGMDWEFNANSDVCSREVHLSPYQGAPFDLHVGAEHMDSTVRKNKSTSVGSGGIYKRRKSSIDAFLFKLSNLDGEDLSNFVYDSINNRVQYVNSSHRPDLTLENDVQHTRTLSMLAVGFGGKMLASIFRCFFFDYRHYSGGLPDLLLVRALYEKSTTADDEHIEELVDLGEWVGETFSEKYQDAVKAKQAWQLLGGDTDDDFLGCSKVGDSGGRNTFKRPSRARNSFGPKNGNEGDKVDVSMPDRLSLSHNSRSIKVECMFVEVKSHSDRLDSRQEDWLNILDLHGNSRVCKFEKAPKHNKNAKKKSKS